MTAYPHSLAEDLLLLSIRQGNGRIATAGRIDYGLMGAELVGLAACGRIDVDGGKIRVLSAAPTGDAELDAALASLQAGRRPPLARTWVVHPRRGIRAAYLRRLTAAGALRAEPGSLFGTRYRIADEARAAATRARLDEIALSDGPVDPMQAAFGGLVHATGLDHFLYPTWSARPVHRRLGEMGKGQWTVRAVPAAGGAAGAVAGGATAAATEAAVRAATEAAIQAAIEAATQAATQGATQAATGAHHAGGATGGHAGHH